MDTLKLIGAIATMPLAVANKFGWVLAGIWLAVQADWAPLVYGTIFGVVGWFGLAFALVPSVAVSSLAATIFARGGASRWLGFPLFAIGGLLQYLVFAVYVFVVYRFVFDSHFSSPTWVVALWAFSIIGGTFGFMARHEASASGGRIDSGLVFAVVAVDILAAILGVGMVMHWPTATLYAVGFWWLLALTVIVAVLSAVAMLYRPRIGMPYFRRGSRL